MNKWRRKKQRKQRAKGTKYGGQEDREYKGKGSKRKK